MANAKYGDVSLLLEQHVAFLEIHRPPHNYFDIQLMRDLGEAFRDLESDPACRAVVLASEGKSFCAGTNFGDTAAIEKGGPSRTEKLYAACLQLFSFSKPIVASIQGPAIGGGLGFALLADFRVVSPEARFAANFVKIGLHPGFGLTFTLPRLIGIQKASLLFYTGRRIGGEEAVAWSLGDILAPADQLRQEAKKLTAEIAENAPLAVQSARATVRRGIEDNVKAHLAHELTEQMRLRETEDHKEGLRAVSERRPGRFTGA